jgi:hypothetical protein
VQLLSSRFLQRHRRNRLPSSSSTRRRLSATTEAGARAWVLRLGVGVVVQVGAAVVVRVGVAVAAAVAVAVVVWVGVAVGVPVGAGVGVPVGAGVGVAASGRRGAGGADFQFDRVSAKEPSLDSAQQHSRQLGDVDGYAPSLVAGEEVRHRAPARFLLEVHCRRAPARWRRAR